VRVPIAKEGLWIIVIATAVCAVVAAGLSWIWWPLGLPLLIVWGWVLAFFRDPNRRCTCQAYELCSPADGTITEISRLDSEPDFNGPAIRIGMFLSLFNVHVNRAPCAGRVRVVTYKPGAFLDARHPESGARNESNTLLIDPDGLPGPVRVRQVAGLVARRIICHAREGDKLAAGERFGMIRFGSRTELIIPAFKETEILVGVGDKVKAGSTVLARQRANGGMEAMPRSGQ